MAPSVTSVVVVSMLLLGSVAAVSATNAKGQAYLDENKGKEGWTELPSGLQYKVITNGGSDEEPPRPNERVKVHYRGTLIDGTEFDSSYKRNSPATFGVTQVIKGWTEALQLMRPGDVWEVALPSEIAYGSRSVGAFIQANDALLFKIELLEVLGRSEL